MKEMSGADMVVQALVDLGVDTVFGYPGGAVLPIYDALFNHPSIKHVLVRHEQAATHAAEGYARSTGKPGVVLVTSGPGATNAVTGITDALLDSIPMVVLTGQVPTTLIGTDAFQECDTVGITRHCTKHNYLVMDPDRLGAVIHEAFYIATHGRPGPVVIDIPKNVQVATGSYSVPEKIEHQSYRPQVEPDAGAIAQAIDMIAAAERPIFYTGGGVINAGPDASAALRQLVSLTGAPITSTLMGLGAFPSDDPKWLGMLGMHGTYESNMAMNRADLIIAVGARFDDRVTGRLDAFAPEAKKIHIDIDRSSINKIVPVDIAVVGDAGRALDALIAAWADKGHKARDLGEWWRRIDGWRATRCLDFPEKKDAGAEIMPQRAVKALFDATILEGEFVEWVENSHLLKRAFREVAVIGGLIERQHPGKRKTGKQVTFSTDLIFDVLRKYEPDHLLIEAAWADARERLTDVARLGDLLDRAAGTMVHQRLERISPLAIPVLVLIGRENVAASDLDDALLGELADTLAATAMGGA